jgi:hypothetical protein
MCCNVSCMKQLDLADMKTVLKKAQTPLTWIGTIERHLAFRFAGQDVPESAGLAALSTNSKEGIAARFKGVRLGHAMSTEQLDSVQVPESCLTLEWPLNNGRCDYKDCSRIGDEYFIWQATVYGNVGNCVRFRTHCAKQLPFLPDKGTWERKLYWRMINGRSSKAGVVCDSPRAHFYPPPRGCNNARGVCAACRRHATRT